MKLTIVFMTIGLLSLGSSCSKKNGSTSTEVVGEWKLIEELIDPGDGSGTFQPISSNKEIKFFENGTFEANGDMCVMSNQASSIHEGTYDASLEKFAPDNCVTISPLGYDYSVSGDTLIIICQCIESCKQKYLRI